VKIKYHSYHGGGTHDAEVPFPGSKSVIVPGARCANADCSGGEDGLPLVIAGVRGTEKESHSEVEFEAACVRCGKTVGRIVVTFDTIFGLREDHAVLFGRPRVYG
jgi:hypothetical protein